MNFAMKKIFEKENLIFASFLATAILVWIGIIIYGNSQYVDEIIHRRQILRIFKGNFSILNNLTTLPGYHFVLGAITKITNITSSVGIRFFSFIFSLLTILPVFLIAKKTESKYPLLKVLQYIFLPIVFFYFPLIYTDIFSLLLLLWAFYFALGKRFTLSAFFWISFPLCPTKQYHLDSFFLDIHLCQKQSVFHF